MDNDKLKRKLKLYYQYVEILEHLCVVNGLLALDDKKYNKLWLKRNANSFLEESREMISKKIQELDPN